MQTLVLCYH